MSYIYVIVNNINDMMYVGQTTRTIEERYAEHLSTVQSRPLNDSFKKYGIDNFSVHQLEEVINGADLDKREIFWIKKIFSKFPLGYNLTSGGHGTKGYIFTDADKLKMSAKSRINWNNIERRLKAGARTKLFWTGRKRSYEQRLQLSIRGSLRTGDKNSFYGKHHTDKTKKILAEAQYGRISLLRKPIIAYKDGFEKHFDCQRDAYNWLYENGYTKSIHETSVESTIRREAIGTNNIRYGFKWKDAEKV